MRALILLACAAALPAATAALLDGERVAGPSASFDPRAGTVTIAGRTLRLADVDWIETGAEAAAPAGEAQPGIWLTDGGWLPADRIEAATDAIVAVRGAQRLTLPLAAVAGWGTQLPPPGEGDQLQLAGGTVAGRVEGLAAGALRFASALTPQALPLDQVVALRLAVPPRPPRGLHLLAALHRDRPALRLAPTATGAALAAAPAEAVPTDGLRLRVEGGRRAWLSALTPSAVSETGAFGTVWPTVRDQDQDGNPLVLDGVRAERGLVVHSAAALTWRLDGGYVRLRGRIGIADNVRPEGDCTAELVVDGKALWQGRLTGATPGTALDLDLTGARTLELRVALGERHDIGDHVALADAYLIRK